MSKFFGVVRGSFWIEPGKVMDSRITITGLDLPSEGALVSNFTASDMEKSSIIQCFNNVNHVYAFGHDPEQSGFSVTYLVFMGKSCQKEDFEDSGNMAQIVSKYNSLKVSEKKATVDVTLGSGLVLVGIVLSCNIAVYEAETNSVTITVAGKTLMTTDGGSGGGGLGGRSMR